MALKLTTRRRNLTVPLSLFSSSCSSYTHSPLTSPPGHRIHHHHSCVTPLRATIPRANGFSTRIRLNRGMTRAVRRYTKGGIALPMRNPTARICSVGGGNRLDVISSCRPGFLPERYRNTNIGFVGDSLNRNMYLSLVCMLKRASTEVKKWRSAGADRGLTFVRYNLTLAYHRTYLLVRYGSWSATSDSSALESLGYKQGYRIDVDVPDQKWAEAPKFHHILVFNTGHWWWAPSKFDPVQSPMLFFQNGAPVIPPLTPPLGMDLALKHMLRYIENLVGPDKFLFFRTQSPRHFEGRDWNAGGSCRRDQPLSIDEVGELFSVERNGTNVESRLINQHLFEALKGSRFHILDITSMSVFRADAHPSTTGGKKHEDCMHWCLPGLPDIWNDLFVATLETLQIK